MARPEQNWITFEIDGKEVRAPEGAMLVDAAKEGDVEIPYFCYEKKLGQPAQTVPAPSMSHGRARKRYARDVSAPTGQSSMMLPLNGAT